MAGNRFISMWHHAEQSARLSWFACGVEAAVAGLSLVVALRVMARPREVIRIACDWTPALMRIDDARYSEPDEREIKAFAATFATFYLRRDSYSIVNDFVWCATRMAPEIREKFKALARGTPDRPGLIHAVERLRQRSEIDPAALEISVDQHPYPWHATVRGVVHVVGETSPEGQRFEMELELVRTSRDRLIEGLLVWALRTAGPLGHESLDQPS